MLHSKTDSVLSFVPQRNTEVCCVAVNHRQPGGEVQTGQQQRRRRPQEQSEEPRRPTATRRRHQPSGRCRLCAGARMQTQTCTQHLSAKSFKSASFLNEKQNDHVSACYTFTVSKTSPKITILIV